MQKKQRRRDASLSKEARREVDAKLDRYIARWARHLIVVDDDGTVRRLTEQEIRAMTTRARNGASLSKSRRGKSQSG